jgi:hypothetical protein
VGGPDLTYAEGRHTVEATHSIEAGPKTRLDAAVEKGDWNVWVRSAL